MIYWRLKTINDPLDGQDVTIIVTLPVSEKLKDERQVLVSIGVANQIPVLKTGVFGNLTELMDDGWKAFGVQVEATKAAEGPRRSRSCHRKECRNGRCPRTHRRSRNRSRRVSSG